jgi:hypothetical protein
MPDGSTTTIPFGAVLRASALASAISRAPALVVSSSKV